jgi:GNAT superfamily N-acetyltransferase
MTEAPCYVIRRATVDDVEFLIEVVIAATEAQGRLTDDLRQPAYRQWTQALVDGRLPGSQTSVIEVDGERIGRLRIVRSAAGIDLAGIHLAPRAQRRGIGTAIIESLKTEATAAAVPLELGVESDNPDARRLYHRLGFVEIAGTEREHRLRWTP